MAQFSSGNTLDFLVGRVLEVKPNASQSAVVNALNARVRETINSRIYWSDLLVERILSFPTAYIEGAIAFATGSSVVVGTGTGWPVNDVVNTTSTTGVQDYGYIEITPASMHNIAVDTLLYYDPAGGTPEVVPVVEVTPTSFWGKFSQAHNAGCAVWSSSLAGMQLNSGDDNPVFDVMATPNAITMILNQPWGGPATTEVNYQVLRQYVTIDPMLKVILSVIDTQQGIPLQIYTPLEKLDALDPQRSSQQNPLCLTQFTPTPAGSMRYEVYPSVIEAYQLRAIVGLQWPDMKYDTDRSPWFIDPNLFVTGACADILRIKNTRMDSDKDPWFNPQLAMQYEQMFRLRLQDCINADEAKAQRAFQTSMNGLQLNFPGGYPGGNWALSHDADLLTGNL